MATEVPVSTLSPETPEGRERIARLESQVDDVERQVDRNERVFGPLPLAVERIQWTVDAINNRLDKRDRELDETFDKLTRSFENQVIACRGAVEDVSKEQKRQSEVFLAWQEQERKRRDDERKAEREETSTDRNSRRAAFALIAAAGVTGIFGLMIQLIGLVT